MNTLYMLEIGVSKGNYVAISALFNVCFLFLFFGDGLWIGFIWRWCGGQPERLIQLMQIFPVVAGGQ